MSQLVVDANVAIKWVFAEEGAAEAMQLARSAKLIAPELLLCECANAIWKRVRRGEYTAAEGEEAVALIEDADVILFEMAPLLAQATRLAIKLDHAAYDCFYLALAEAQACPLVTADARLIAKVRKAGLASVEVLNLAEAAAL